MRRFKTSGLLVLGLFAAMSMVLSACATGDTTPALTSDDVEEIVATEVAGVPVPEAGLSQFEVETLLTGMIADYLVSQPRLSRDDVEDIVASALANAPQPEAGVSRAEVEEIVSAAISDALAAAIASVSEIDVGVSEEEVRAVVADALSAVPTPEPGVTAEEVEAIVSTAVAAIPAPERGLDRDDVESIVSASISAIPTIEAEPGVSAAEVEEIVNAAIAAIPEVDPGLSSEEAELIARRLVADIPTEAAPAKFTRFFVDNAISRYETEGRETTLEYYNSKESLDGRWYVFIVDETDTIIGHYDPRYSGQDIKGEYGVDANGREFWPEVLEATEEGKWVSYVSGHPGAPISDAAQRGAVEYKHVWVVKHDGLLFGSGWYVSADEYTQSVVDDAIRMFEEQGLLPTLTHYNSERSVEGEWYVFIAGPDRSIIGHYQRALIGSPLSRLLGTQVEVNRDGLWHVYGDVNPMSGEFEPKIFWLIEHGGYVFGSGWHRLGNPIPEYN